MRVALALFALVVALQPAPAAAEPAAIAPAVAFQQLEARLFGAGWALARANARFCATTAPSLGLQLHDAATYSDPAAVRRQLRLTGDIGVQAVAADSPAALAGLAANATLVRINDRDVAGAFPPTEPTWRRLLDVIAALERELAGGSIELAWSDPQGGETLARLTAVPVCATRFELLDGNDGPAADGTRVVMGARFAGRDWPDDEFAAAIAHELAHNLLGHRATFDRTGRKQKLVRLSERDADRLMPWLLQNAGYDPHAAIRFMRRWGPRYGGGILRSRTHDGWDERAEHIAAEIAAMQPHIAADGSADWSLHFRQELAAELRR